MRPERTAVTACRVQFWAPHDGKRAVRSVRQTGKGSLELQAKGCCCSVPVVCGLNVQKYLCGLSVVAEAQGHSACSDWILAVTLEPFVNWQCYLVSACDSPGLWLQDTAVAFCRQLMRLQLVI